MSKRKRTYEEVEAMKAKAIRFQENVGHFDAMMRLESLSVEDYAALRNIEIVPRPIRKRRAPASVKSNVPPGYGTRTKVKQWTEPTKEGRTKQIRETTTEVWKEE